MFNQLLNTPIPKEYSLTWLIVAKDECQIVQKAKLLETNLDNTITAKNVRKVR